MTNRKDLPFIIEGMLGRELSNWQKADILSQVFTIADLEGLWGRELKQSEREHLKGWLN